VIEPVEDLVIEPVDERVNEPVDESEPSGSGGWLSLFALGLIGSLFLCLKILYDNFSLLSDEGFKLLTDPGSTYYVITMFPSFIIETTLISAQILMILLILYMGLKHKKLFKYLSISFILFNLLVTAIDTLMFKLIESTLSGLITINVSYTDIFRACIYAAIWIPYFLRSKRVKNTFIY
jgi:hypothetical protein